MWKSEGQDAIDLAKTAGLLLDPWQCYVLDHSLAIRRNGTWAAKEVGVCVSRQNGKGSILEARELAGLFLLDEEFIIHSAHLFPTSMEALERIALLIEQTPDLDRFVSGHGGKITRSHGSEGIQLYRDGKKRRLRFTTRTKGGGRGLTADCVICDEAMFLDSAQIAALMPTLSARPNPQIWYTGSAGNIDSEHFGRVRERGVRGTEKRLFYCEWSVDACSDFCPDDCEDHDEDGVPAANKPVTEGLVESYAKANPGLGIRISLEACEQERHSMDAEAFKCERLGVGQWPVEGESWRVISEEAWMARWDKASRPLTNLVFAVGVTPDRQRSCIAVAGANEEGQVHIEITGAGEEWDHQPGTRWIVPRIQQLVRKHKGVGVVINRATQANMFYDEFEADPNINLLVPINREYAAACGWLVGGCVPRKGNSPWIAHANNSPLTNAVAGAAKREIQELWAWDKPTSITDITPLEAATLAAWGHHKIASKPRPRPKMAWR